MLCYRLLHYGDALPDISTGLKNRDLELGGPVIQLFYGTDALDEIIDALKKFLVRKKKSSPTV